MDDLQGMSFQRIFETRNCGAKTIFELRGLIEEIHKKESFEHSKEMENFKASTTEKIYIPIYFRDLPLNFVLETERLRSLARRLKFKTLGDFHDLEFTQIKNTKHVGDKTFSEFQELIEKTQNGEFDDYLNKNQSNSFKTKLISKLGHRIHIPDEIKNIEVKFVFFSSKLLKILRKLNVETLGDMELFDFNALKLRLGIGQAPIFELWQFISRMQKGAEEGVDLRAETDFDFPVKVTFSGPTLNDLLTHINNFIAELSERGQEVLVYRFGGTTDEKILTLEEIGKKFQVTRERIRQIENKHITRLKNNLTEISDTVFNKLNEECQISVCPLTAGFLIHLTGNDYELFNIRRIFICVYWKNLRRTV